MTLVLATRGSPLALAQSGAFARELQAAAGVEVRLHTIRTRGDAVQDRPLAAIGGKGLFTAELEAALRDGSVHLAVHSLKDLPTADAPGLVVGCVPRRADPRDVLLGVGSLHDLPSGARVGTGSQRRRVQLLALRPDLELADLRGNVDTRLRKLRQGEFQAIVLAQAGLDRLGLDPGPTPWCLLEPPSFVPAPAQGALGVQCRADDASTRAYLTRLHHGPTALAVQAERAFLAAVGGGCSVPAGAFASVSGAELHLVAMLAGADGAPRTWSGTDTHAGSLGRRAAAALLA